MIQVHIQSMRQAAEVTAGTRPFDPEVFMPSNATATILGIHHRLREHGVADEEFRQKTAEFFTSPDIDQGPYLRISCMLFAARNVGPREIREFLGALQDVEATKGIFITTSSFSPDSRELARRRRIVLIDGLELATHMVDAGLGVATLQTYELKRIDEDYFAQVE